MIQKLQALAGICALGVAVPTILIAFYAASRRGADLESFGRVLLRLLWLVYGTIALVVILVCLLENQ